MSRCLSDCNSNDNNLLFLHSSLASCSNIASLDISSSSLALNPTLLSKHYAINPFSKFNSLVNIQEIQKAELPESFNFPWKLRDIVIANVGKIHSLIGRMAAVSYVSRQQITEVIHEAFIANDTTLNESSALQWAEGFLFPPHVWSKDNDKLIELENNFPALISFRQAESKYKRLNLSRVHNLQLRESVWKKRLITIADGIPIITAPNFIPSNIPPPLRKKYTLIAPAINKQIYDLYQKSLIVILPTSVAKTIEKVHFSAIHWTAQHDKAQGRTLADPSSGSNPLNTPAAKEIVDEVCGNIEHPTLQMLMDMLIEYGERIGSFDDLLLWKRDLSGAFTLLDILPDHVSLCAYELTDNLTMFYHSGFFGHLELPAMFNIITMVSKLELKNMVSGCLEQYVDDFMAVSLSGQVASDMKIVGDFVDALLGPNSLNTKKDVIGRQIDWIGWGINLDSMRVTVSRKNLMKCVHGFFFIDVEQAIAVKEIEKLASWSSRYSLILQSLKPLSAALHYEHSGLIKRNARKKLSDDAILVVWIWRSFLVLIAIHPELYSRPILSFKIRFTSFLVEFDASLEGLGIVISTVEKSVISPYKAASINTPYLLEGNSGYQNTMEFIAMVFSICYIRSQGFGNVGVDFIGDSSSALSWAMYERFKRGSSVSAALLFMRVASTSFIDVNHITHIAGVNNIVCDKLSRHYSPTSLGFSSNQSIFQEQLTWMDDFFSICNPLRQSLSSHDLFLQLWNQLTLFVEII